MQKPQVLIVDDNVIALKLLRKYLEASDLRVIEATDGHHRLRPGRGALRLRQVRHRRGGRPAGCR